MPGGGVPCPALRRAYAVQLRPDTDSGYPLHLFRRYLEVKDPAAKRDAALLILANAPEFNANVGETHGVAPCPSAQYAPTTTELGCVEFPVARERDPMRLEALGQLFDEVDRAVLPPGAADGHRDIAAVVARQGVEPAL